MTGNGEALPAEQTRRLWLGGGTKGVVTRCRDFTREALTDWQWLPASGDSTPLDGTYPDPPAGQDPEEWQERWAAVEDALLLVSEVVTNACMHAGGPTELLLHRAPGLLRIEVTDPSPVTPRVRPSGDPALPGGHGLVVLERLSREWGYRPAGSGKTVWLEVPAPAPLTREGRSTARDGRARPDRPAQTGQTGRSDRSAGGPREDGRGAPETDPPAGPYAAPPASG